MSYQKPRPDGEAVKETRQHIRELYENGELAISNKPSVTTRQLAASCEYGQRTINSRLNVDPAIEQVTAIDPQTFESTTAYVLSEDLR